MFRGPKYRNQKVAVDGMCFDSRREAERWGQLKRMQQAGRITDLMRQQKFVLIPSQRIDGKVVERECSYIADFVYIDTATGKTVVEDAKGFATPDYKIKRKLMLQRYGIWIVDV